MCATREWCERKVCRLTGDAESLEALLAVALRDRIRHVCDRLRRLADWHRGDDPVGQSVDRSKGISVLQANINPAPIARGPDAMWQLAHGYRSHLREIVGAEDLDLVPAADGDIGKHPIGIAHDVDVIGERAGVQGLEQREGRLGIEHLGFPDVFKSPSGNFIKDCIAFAT